MPKWQVIGDAVRGDAVVVSCPEAIAYAHEDDIPFENLFAGESVELG